MKKRNIFQLFLPGFARLFFIAPKTRRFLFPFLHTISGKLSPLCPSGDGVVTQVVTSKNGEIKPFSYRLSPLVPLILKNTLHMKRFFMKTAKNHSKKLVCIFNRVVTECRPQGKWLEIKPFCCHHLQFRKVVTPLENRHPPSEPPPPHRVGIR